MTQSVTTSEVAEVNARFVEAYARGDAAGVAAVYTDDARLLPPGAPTTTGRPAIAEFWQGAMDAGVAAVDLQTTELVEHGDAAHEIGRAELTVVDGDGSRSTQTAKYVVVWRRVDEGWRWDVDIWNEPG
jgi:uncharacterized protein (TIGR02246 family)